MKKFLAVLLVLICLTMTAQAAEKPVRIARLPIIFQTSSPDLNTCAELEVKIARAVHIPMNKTLKLAEYLPTKKSTQALTDIWKEIRAENEKARLAEAMRPLADKLDADIVVCPVLNRYSQTVMMSGFYETIINSYVKTEMIVYDRRTDNLIDKKSSQYYHGDYIMTGTAAYLAKICFDKVINDSQLRQLILAIR